MSLALQCTKTFACYSTHQHNSSNNCGRKVFSKFNLKTSKFCKHVSVIKQIKYSRSVLVRAEPEDEVGKKESRDVLDAFFVGRAFADVVSEKLGTALGELLSEVAKKDAERRREVRDFQEEVRKRAREEQARAVASAAASTSVSPTKSTEIKMDKPSVPSSQPVKSDSKLADSVNGLNSEVAQAKNVSEKRTASNSEDGEGNGSIEIE
mmetsp:Transcript_21424/g.29764  ORF Transcript_21424/g.29764 Transcript_21424/m.29764 type:complete len:208 (-) Transcript_21424:227-850(-)|eukprot:CAMPEP_0196586904 /NCGR_PEP_ID=MMETSP1081-20130531/55882_1 /TAXON_ID=36882 /ORGANISM="Pyramimonas amylifera, Strain CCMP720" /LENGTH=207 /DNA_ID=CAMNT_0041908927 /DNA_START=123 /DNA_END=746 /DNA_ORIENTATION=+